MVSTQPYGTAPVDLTPGSFEFSMHMCDLASFSPVPVDALNNGVGKLPALGYNTWNAYGCNIDEDLVLESAQLMVSLGLQAVGYEYVNIDDCYAEKNRSASGDIVADSVRFAHGMKNLTDQIHKLGFKTGIYSDSGWFTCGGYPGSFQNELRDATTFQDWGFDYLKFDNCAIPFDDIIREGMIGKYTRMSDALAQLSQSSGQPPFLFSLCQWGWEQVWLWGSTLGHSWRVTGDIAPEWDSLALIINFNSFITQATDFYGHNDMDMPDWTSNSTSPAQYYSGPSENGTVFMLLNTLNETSDMFFNLTESPWIRAGRQYSVRDLWTHTDNGTAVRNFTAVDVPPHGVVALLLNDAGDEPAGIFPPCAVWFNCAYENGTAAN
ncbi:hypothetical protein HHX47_DHR5000632 [Lentinula edodes]|nr:hypothetical protein HHX47_DHR5000632 [Lentinula edodes]